MLTLILLATCIPILAGVAYVAVRDKYPKLLADVRGIALQTVIIIVVLLAIAGAVAGVLLSRTGDATSALESQEIVPGLVTDATTCGAYRMGGVAGSVSGNTCTWEDSTTGAAVSSPVDVTRSKCLLVRGTYIDPITTTGSEVPGRCELTIS